VDTLNHRVLIFPTAGQAAAATEVLGQSGFLYNSPNSIHGEEFFFGTNANSSDAGIAVDSSTGTPHLYVSDPGNNRVLGFADARKVGPGVKADIVIGEPDLMTAVCNYQGQPNPPSETNLPARQPTASSLCYPTGVAVDPSGNLFVADSANGRVLRFPAPFATPTSLEPANLVLGQSAFTGISNPEASQSVMVYPYGLFFDPARGLFVSDESANRVLLFPMASPSNGEAASTVFGQSNFTATGNSVLSAPHHIGEDTIAEVYVADSGHNQIQVFNIPSGSSTDTPVNSFTGLGDPQAVWVNQNDVANYHNDIWVGSSSGISRYPVPNPLVSGNTPSLTMQAAEVAGTNITCAYSTCGYPAIAITQDSFGALYVADTSNRVSIHYPAVAGENAASAVCAMGCTLGGLNDPQYYLAPGAFTSVFAFSPVTFPVTATTNYVLPVPTTLGGVQVVVNGVASPITSVSPSQINFVVPFEAPTSGTMPVIVVDASTSQVLGSGTMTMNEASPGFFTMNQQGTGQIAALNCNKVVNNNCDDAVNGTANPANLGSTIQLFLTGQGAGLTPSAPKDGQGDCTPPMTGAVPVVYVGATQATVSYSGLAPCYVGLWQLNVEIPKNPTAPGSGFPAGVFPVLVQYDGLVSQPPSSISNPNVATTIVISAPE
jgi:uncharacterized protein (TIGR03437 family)